MLIRELLKEVEEEYAEERKKQVKAEIKRRLYQLDQKRKEYKKLEKEYNDFLKHEV